MLFEPCFGNTKNPDSEQLFEDYGVRYSEILADIILTLAGERHFDPILSDVDRLRQTLVDAAKSMQLAEVLLSNAQEKIKEELAK